MVASRLWQSVTSSLESSRPASTWQLVSDRHDPSTFSGLDIHYLKFTSAIPFRNMTSGVTVETVGDDSWRVVTTRRIVTIRREGSPFLRPVTDRVYWTWVSQIHASFPLCPPYYSVNPPGSPLSRLPITSIPASSSFSLIYRLFSVTHEWFRKAMFTAQHRCMTRKIDVSNTCGID